MMFALVLGLLTVAVVALAGGVGYRIFSARQRIGIPPLKDRDADLGPREPLSKVLSGVSFFALFSAVLVGFYRRNMDLYATELRIIGAAMAIGLLAALANRYFYGRWM